MYILNMAIILIVMYCNVVTAIDKIPTYLLRFNRYLKVDIEKVKWSIDRDRANTSERALLGKKGICMSAIACVRKKFNWEKGRRGGHAWP